MLRELYDYALRENLILPAGYVKKPVRAYISLSRGGKYVGIISTSNEKVPCPDIGSLANSGDKCNVLAEKRSILFPSDEKQREKYAAKAAYFRETMADAARMEPRLKFCLDALCNEEVAASVSGELDRLKLDGAKVLSFMVDGVSILEYPSVRSWWEQFRQQFRPSGSRAPCLITGKLTIPTATVPPISGLSVVGGHARGDALICFDKDAFCSYGLKQGANAPVSEDAFAGVKAALDELLKKAPVLSGMKFVHWYDKPVEAECDCIDSIICSAFNDEDDEDADLRQEPDVDPKLARDQANEHIASVKAGTTVHDLPNLYYILLLSGVGGRVMVRSYEVGNYGQLTENLRKWESDLSLINSSGTAAIKPAKLSARLIRLMAKQSSDKNVFDRMSKELAGLTPAIISAIINGTQLPSATAVRALSYIRSQMLSSTAENQVRKTPDPWACQWLKVWLCRKERQKYQKEELAMEYNEKHPEPAYHCGALVAVYGEIQRLAMGDVNASLIDRYYASAIQTPALVLGQLSKLSNYHIGKLSNWQKKDYAELRDQVACAIGDNVPTVLSPELQSYFALGYYQMCAKIAKDRRIRAAAAAEKKAD